MCYWCTGYHLPRCRTLFFFIELYQPLFVPLPLLGDVFWWESALWGLMCVLFPLLLSSYTFILKLFHLFLLCCAYIFFLSLSPFIFLFHSLTCSLRFCAASPLFSLASSPLLCHSSLCFFHFCAVSLTLSQPLPRCFPIISSIPFVCALSVLSFYALLPCTQILHISRAMRGGRRHRLSCKDHQKQFSTGVEANAAPRPSSR